MRSGAVLTTERAARNRDYFPGSHPPQHGVHLGRCLLLLGREHVGLDIEGDGCGGVTQPLEHDPDGYTGLEQMGSMRVAKIVRADGDAMLAGETGELSWALRYADELDSLVESQAADD